MFLLLPGCTIYECLPRDVKSNRKFHGNRKFLGIYFLGADVVKTCTDEGSYQDKIRTQSFRGHTLKGFSLYFSFQALQALGKFV